MKLYWLPISVLLVLSFCLQGIVCPFPKCGPLVFINKIIESRQLRWLFFDAPGHPVPPCPYKNPNRAPLEERFLIFRPLDHPQSGPKEGIRTIRFFMTKGFPRIFRRILGQDRRRTGQRPRGRGQGRGRQMPM